MCGGHSPALHASARNPAQHFPFPATCCPECSRAKRSARRRGRPFVCWRSFVFQTFRVSKLRGRKDLCSLQASLSSSKPSRPSFHILQLTVWDLPRFIPHSQAQSLHAVQPEKMRAHPLPFSAGCCRQPSPLPLVVAVAGVPAPRSGTRSARPAIQSAFAERRSAGLGDKNSPVRASERDFSPVSMSTIQSIFAIRLSVAEALSCGERCPSPVICAGIPELPGCGVKRQGLWGKNTHRGEDPRPGVGVSLLGPATCPLLPSPFPVPCAPGESGWTSF